MQFEIKNLESGASFKIDIAGCANLGEVHDLLKEKYGFGDADFLVVDGLDPEAAVFMQSHGIDPRAFDYMQIDDRDVRSAVLAWIDTQGGSDSVKWILDGYVAYCDDRDDYLAFLNTSFNIPEELERFIDSDAVEREGNIVFQVAKRAGTYYIFQRH